jgi:hypothetical protein
MCAELDVVDVKVDEEEDWYVILRGVDDDGNTYEPIDVTDQDF